MNHLGDDDKNSSLIVLNMIPDVCGDVEVVKIILPVVYKTAYLLLTEYVQTVSPDYVLCMGQAGGRKKISIERIAVNINNSSAPDNDGQILTDKAIVADGQAAYITDMPVFDMMGACDEDIVSTSYSAGTFVCNDLFYRMMYQENHGEKEFVTGFLHLPYTEHFGKIPFNDSKKQAETVISMISALGDRNG